ncbi:hypothetical protein KPL70_002762 [Citrus sinensis]|uniref:Nucleotide-diphospho-sugar transferase domain-containing protein n=2 Tax=Citrus TaxID=2706 RepID=V4U655_CITCL|nr:uncharacterized protein LOC18051117 [Citrus x clementina]XP_006470513.2 uncharacterized protein LOC102622818 [Citrus sinensis]ESR59590.1 hypothetical protein CICLE_v10014615mg [Citrus x clementina]KAH9741815.1 hypothetical protein KPL70_002762 [Citrus sinensis]GAY50889.1 hypothetical protein CUMW_130090 [Citrus unshiu]
MVGSNQKRHLLLYSLVALVFFYSYYYHSSLPTSKNLTRTETETFNLIPQNAPSHSSNFTLIIKVLTFNRLNSLSRCLHSLSAADYLTDRVHLHVYVDHSAPLADQSSSESDSRAILRFLDGFEWKFGDKFVHYRTANAGLQAQWLEAWWPTSDHEFAFVVEDDLEVSPLFYKFLRGLIVNYYYHAPSNLTRSIYGASLQRPRFVPGKHGNKIHLDNGTQLFLYQLVGTWGQLLFPQPWKEFRLWYDDHKARGIKPFLDGMVTTGWYKKMGERIWTPWFIKFIYSHGYFNFYTHFPNERALSVSHRDAGVNYGKSAGPDSKLLDESSLDFNILKMQPLSNLKWYDFCFREVFPGRVVKSMDDLGTVLPSVQRQETVLVVSLFGASDAVTRNLLCQFERINSQNHIFLGSHSDFLYDLARRGNPVIDADLFLNDIRAYESLSLQSSDARLTKEVLVKVYVIKKCLEYRYSAWVVDANFLPFSNDLFLEPIDATSDFYYGESSKLLFVKSSSSVQKMWTKNFLYEVANLVDKVSLPRDHRNFANIMANLLRQKAGVMIKRVDESKIGLDIGTGSANQSSSAVGKKIVYWSADLGPDRIQKQLEELSLWDIDSDSSCKAVICHQS